jgi:putative transcriptional regulator
MKKTEIRGMIREAQAIDRGEAAPARVRQVTRLPDGTLRRVTLDPEAYRRKQARAWKVKSEAAKVRHELNLTQEDFASLLGVSSATVRKWERGTGLPSGAARTLLAVVRTHPDIVRKAVLAAG